MTEARRGTEGTFAETYRDTVRYTHATRRLEVSVAQRSPRVFSYRETPSLMLSRLGGPAVSHSYEVLEGARAAREGPAGPYSCSQARWSSRWSCTGPYSGIGMGTTGALLGPYPPQALLLGLDNAVETFTGEPSPRAIRRQPAFFLRERLAGRSVNCLSFGRPSHVVGRVCLDAGGVVAYYVIPESAGYSSWETARLLAYSPTVRAGALALPAAPQPINTLRSSY